MIKILKSYNEKEIFDRSNATVDVSEVVREIIENVRINGDSALKEYSKKFDRVDLSCFEIDSTEMKKGIRSYR